MESRYFTASEMFWEELSFQEAWKWRVSLINLSDFIGIFSPLSTIFKVQISLIWI